MNDPHTNLPMASGLKFHQEQTHRMYDLNVILVIYKFANPWDGSASENQFLRSLVLQKKKKKCCLTLRRLTLVCYPEINLNQVVEIFQNSVERKHFFQGMDRVFSFSPRICWIKERPVTRVQGKNYENLACT